DRGCTRGRRGHPRFLPAPPRVRPLSSSPGRLLRQYPLSHNDGATDSPIKRETNQLLIEFLVQLEGNRAHRGWHGIHVSAHSVYPAFRQTAFHRVTSHPRPPQRHRYREDRTRTAASRPPARHRDPPHVPGSRTSRAAPGTAP